MAWDKGWNFRGTVGFVTDGTNETYSIGAAYPETRNGVTFGWTVALTGSVDRFAANDRRLAGISYKSNSDGLAQSVFRVDLPAAGQYSVRLSMGDHDGPQAFLYCQILDGATPLLTINDVAGTAANVFDDATQTQYTAANWPGSNSPVTVAFVGTTLNLKIGYPTVQVSSSTLTHLFISQLPVLSAQTVGSITTVGGTPAVTTDTGNGTAYMVVVPTGDIPSVAQIKLGQQSSGAAALANQNQVVVATGVQTFAAVTGLVSSTAYDVWFVQTNAASQNSAAVKASFTTLVAIVATGGKVVAMVVAKLGQLFRKTVLYSDPNFVNAPPLSVRKFLDELKQERRKSLTVERRKLATLKTEERKTVERAAAIPLSETGEPVSTRQSDELAQTIRELKAQVALQAAIVKAGRKALIEAEQARVDRLAEHALSVWNAEQERQRVMEAQRAEEARVAELARIKAEEDEMQAVLLLIHESD